MIRPHVLAGPMMDDLALGFGGRAAVQTLWEGQRSRRLLLFRLVVDGLGPARDVDAATAAIIEAERREPLSRSVLAEPFVGAWAAVTVRALADSASTPAQRGHLGAVAAVATLRAGTAAELSGWTRGGWLHLPQLGRVRAAVSDGPVTLTIRDGRLWIDGVPAAPDGPDGQARRSLRAGDLTVAFDDVDPYRDAYHVPAAGRLSAEAVAEWGRLLAETWHILTTWMPGRAAEIAAGLHSLVPLERRSPSAAHSATAREAVGVVGLDRPRRAADFAVALVHEFQHSKLSAVLDIVPLYDGSSGRTFFAPWRIDPRPIGGLFQGVYAFLAVADAWRALAQDPASFPQAEREFAEAGIQVSDALDTLDTSGLLTAAGRRFVSGMRRSLGELELDRLPPAARGHAHRVLAQRRSRWERQSAG